MTDTSNPTMTPARERLEALRAEAADLAARKAAVTADPAPVPDDGPRVAQVGDVVHFVRAGFSVPQSLPSEWIGGPGVLTMRRGDELTITERHVAAARDRLGGPGWLALVHDPEAQRRRFGYVVIVPGPAPEGMEPWIVGDRGWALARENAMQAAGALGDSYERQAAIQRVQQRFGGPWDPNVGTMHVRGDGGDEAMRR